MDHSGCRGVCETLTAKWNWIHYGDFLPRERGFHAAIKVKTIMVEMKYNLIEIKNGVPIKAWTKGVKLEDEAKKQLLNVAQLPFVYKWVAAMPDVHWGIGATVGSVIPTKGAIIPAAVGVDIGCFTGDTLVPLLD